MLWYTPPSQEIFDEIKAGAIEIWNTYDNTYGYVTEKVTYINGLQNVGANYMTIIGMFDHWNKKRLYRKLSDAARERIILAYGKEHVPDVAWLLNPMSLY